MVDGFRKSINCDDDTHLRFTKMKLEGKFKNGKEFLSHLMDLKEKYDSLMEGISP